MRWGSAAKSAGKGMGYALTLAVLLFIGAIIYFSPFSPDRTIRIFFGAIWKAIEIRLVGP